jgi:hypothetical protein
MIETQLDIPVETMICYLKTNDFEHIDPHIFTKLIEISDVIECCVEKSENIHKIILHSSITRGTMKHILDYIMHAESFLFVVDRLNKDELLGLLNACHYLNIKDMEEVLINKIANTISTYNEEELIKYFS